METLRPSAPGIVACGARDRKTAAGSVRSFARNEDGALIAWFLFTVMLMLLGVGIGIDAMRTESVRAHTQNTLDRAILAAADLEQGQDPETVVRDYFTRAGFSPEAVAAVSFDDTGTGINQKVVTSSLNIDMPTMILDTFGFGTLPVRTDGTAIESVTDVEIALVLDNSGSMGWNNDLRLDLLKEAAKNFIDQTVTPTPEGESGHVSISIVPFATQVNAGEMLGGQLDFSSEHSYSHCAEFPADSFGTVAIKADDPLQRVGHFDISTWDAPVDTFGVVCPFDSSREITPWSMDAQALKDQIDAMWAGGNTSIDVGAKWGAALLDPGLRPVVDTLTTPATAGEDPEIDPDLKGRPYDYGRPNTMKFLIVMSDGQNTQQFRLESDYMSGASPVWVYTQPGTEGAPETLRYSYFDEDTGQYYVFNEGDLDDDPGGEWRAEPEGAAEASNLTWPDLWNRMSVAYFSNHVKQAAIGGSWETYYNAIYTQTNAGPKNTRAEQICTAARNAGIIVYTVGMDTYGQGDETLEKCAGTKVNFFDVASNDIDAAFSAIARQINQLRLTQ